MFTLFANNWPTYLSGFGYTIAASVLALIASLILGTVSNFTIFSFRPL